MTTNSEPYISNDLFILYSDVVLTKEYTLDELNIMFMTPNTKPYIIIFVKTNLLDYYTHVLQGLNIPFVLITTCNDDVCIPYYFFPHKEKHVKEAHDVILKNPNLIKWLTKNPSILHPKLAPIPLGPKWQWNSRDFFGEDKKPIIDILNKYCLSPSKNFYVGEKPNWLYINMAQTTGNPFYSPHKDMRQNVLDICLEKGFQISPGGSLEHYLENLSQYKFCVCPPGRGIDTHRAWESLMVGTIPIMISTPLDILYDNLPVVIIKSWSELSMGFLEKEYERVRNGKTYDWSVLYAPFWKNVLQTI